MALVVLNDGQRVGDAVTISATVDGVPITVTVWWTHLAGLGAAARALYVATAAKAAAPPASSVVPLAGTVNV